MSELINRLKRASICVYGCGECGLQTYLLLRENGIAIKFFADRDSSKKGYVVNGLSCISYDELLLKEKKNIALVVAIAHGERLVGEFLNLGFDKVFYYEDVKKELYVDMQDRNANSLLMEIEDLQRLKENIEELMFAKGASLGSRRDSILKLIKGKQG